MRIQFVCLLMALACLGAASICLYARAEGTGAPEAKRAFPLKGLFDYESYQKMFRKTYASITEFMARKKLFLARAFRVYLSSFAYRNSLKSYWLSLNERSDWTPEEIKHSYVNYVELRAQNPELYEGLSALDAHKPAEPNLVPIADEHDIAQALDELAKQADQTPGAREISDELQRLSDGEKQTRRRREAKDSSRALSLDDLIENPQKPVDERQALESNNPEYQPPELSSLGVESDSRQPLDERTANYLGGLPGAAFVSSLVSGTSSLFARGQQWATRDAAPVLSGAGPSPDQLAREAAEGEVVDVLHIDHRRSGCFFIPRDQGQCGSCYAFAVVALLEYIHCKQTGERVALSEQYIVDCGHKSHLGGCKGGLAELVGSFVHKYGLELRQNYPYRAKQDSCPYADDVWPKRMGYLRADYSDLMRLLPTAIDEMLVRTPIQIDFALKPDFSEYGGGLDELASGCDRERGHAMLIVGSGTQNGHDYWLVRNSHSHYWGEDGYWKLKKSYDCILNGYATVSLAELNGVPLMRPNKNYDNTSVKQRYIEYMKAGSKRTKMTRASPVTRVSEDS